MKKKNILFLNESKGTMYICIIISTAIISSKFVWWPVSVHCKNLLTIYFLCRWIQNIRKNISNYVRAYVKCDNSLR